MINLTDENFKQETSTGKVVVDVWANWCGVCKMMKPKYEEFAKQHQDLKCFTMDVDKAPKMASELGINNLPTFILFDEGKEISRGGFEVLGGL